MTDRLKTVYPPKTSFCGGYNYGRSILCLRSCSTAKVIQRHNLGFKSNLDGEDTGQTHNTLIAQLVSVGLQIRRTWVRIPVWLVSCFIVSLNKILY